MEIITIIAVSVFAFAFVWLMRYTAYLDGEEQGMREAIKRLSMDGQALVLPVPFDSITEARAERIKRFLLYMKEEHDKSFINKKEWKSGDQRSSGDIQAKERKLEYRGSCIGSIPIN